MPIADPRTHTDAVVAALDAATTHPVGDAVTPATFPHLVVWPFDGGEVDGSLGAPDDYVTMLFQVTCASRDRRQCQWLQHLARQTLLAQTLSVTGRGLFRVMLDAPSGVRTDETLGESFGTTGGAEGGRVFYSTDVFAVRTTPT